MDFCPPKMIWVNFIYTLILQTVHVFVLLDECVVFYFITTKMPQKPTIPDIFYRKYKHTHTHNKMMGNIIKDRQTKSVWSTYGRNDDRNQPLAEDYLKCWAHIVRDQRVSYDGGWVIFVGREKPHHIILKEKYKPHEPVNSIIFKIVNGFAYVFKWK